MYLNGCGGTGEGYKGAGSLILNSWAGGLQQVVNATNEAGTLRRVGMANLNEKSERSYVKSALAVCSWASKPLHSPCKSAPQ